MKVKFNSPEKMEVNGNEIVTYIKSEPKHGKANKEMIRKISELYAVHESSIHIISGLKSTKKIIEIQNK